MIIKYYIDHIARLVIVVRPFQPLVSVPSLFPHAPNPFDTPYIKTTPTAEIRDFPRSPSAAVIETVLGGISNCTRLESCTWTRDGTLSTEVLEALQRLPHLEELEINGHSHGNYDSEVLVGFRELRRIKLIMPEGVVVHGVLRRWIEGIAKEADKERKRNRAERWRDDAIVNGLSALTLICKVGRIHICLSVRF